MMLGTVVCCAALHQEPKTPHISTDIASFEVVLRPMRHPLRGVGYVCRLSARSRVHRKFWAEQGVMDHDNWVVR